MKVVRMFPVVALTLFVASTTFAQAIPRATVTTKKPALPVAKTTEAAKTPSIRPLSVTVNLADSQTQIRGVLTDTTSINIKTSFGQATLPLSEVAGIRMADGSTPTTTVIMHNGDSVTGATDISRLTVETEWGLASINGSNVSSILLAPGLKWNSQSGLNGVRWGLVAIAAPNSTPKPAASNTTGASSTTPRHTSGRPISQPAYTGQPTYRQPMIIRAR